MRLYLSGRISGNDNYKEEFATARAQLENADYDVCDPTTFGFPEDIPWAEAMKYDIREMFLCEGVALLPGWENSPGARVEEKLARDLGMAVMPVFTWLKRSSENE